MKQIPHIPRRILSLFLAAALTITLLIPVAASDALGDDLTSLSTLLSQQTELSTNVFWSTASSDFRTENLITYSPNEHVHPIVTYGSVLTSRSTISNAAKSLESQGYRVVAGINGDYYSLNSGVPVGMVVTDGKLRSTDDGVYAIGFRADGSAVLGRPSLRVSIDLNYGSDSYRQLAAVNKTRDEDGIYLFTYDFNAAHTTGNTKPGIDVLCSVSRDLSIGSTQTLIVQQVLETDTATVINPGQVVLSVNSQCSEYLTSALRNVPVGTEVKLNITANGGSAWNEVQYAVGALYSLVENGSVASGLEAGTHPRTAVGQKADGTLVFYTIDGRKPGHSIGASMTQLAKRLIELGCVTGLCLDGGGSTTLTVTAPGSVQAKTVNTPSEDSERAVTNQLFLVASPTPSGILDHFHLTAEHPYILAGSKTPVYTDAIDTNFIPMSSDYILTSSSGSIEDHVLTTPPEGGDITVTASKGDVTGSVIVHAITAPDSVSIQDSNRNHLQALNLQTGSTAKLNPVITYLHQTLRADPEALNWSVSGGIGTIDQQGNFTATMTGTGRITLTAGSKSTSIPVTVSGNIPSTDPSNPSDPYNPGENPGENLNFPPQTIEDFEGSTSVLQGTGKGIDLSLSRAANTVCMGRGSAKLDYTLLQAENYAAIWHVNKSTTISLGANANTALNFWVYGDGSGNTLSLLYNDGTEDYQEQIATSLDFIGWRQISVSLPCPDFVFQGLKISGTKAVRSGAIYMDQLVAVPQGVVDHTVPSISITPMGEISLDILIHDEVDGFLPESRISVTRDGKAHTFTYDQLTGVLSTQVNNDGRPHRITITALDASGNIGRASYDVPIGESWITFFRDTKDFWGAAYVDYLYTAGITTGYDGGFFRPYEEISRQQFAVMLYRCLGLDGRAYEQNSLPFADKRSISAYAETAIKALYAQGILTGSTGSDGRLYFYPNRSLTRAQAAAMIGRTQAKGYAASSLTFTDSAQIPSYALPYIQTMTAQGIISGYADGSFKPSNNITRGQMAKILYNLM